MKGYLIDSQYFAYIVVFTVLQRYDFESNSQLVYHYTLCVLGCLPYCKGTILKAIHNCLIPFQTIVLGVYRIAKVRFWKQFTTALKVLRSWLWCLPYCKGTILKAIHNWTCHLINFILVFTVLQRYDFESNSQLQKIHVNIRLRCLPYCKGTILKAIHNHFLWKSKR